ncbi:MAG: ribonuclease HI [Cardiobacteriaceae bacterium]|nr:ribonuclease HI [Cardiobacteriaceae bacterium]
MKIEIFTDGACKGNPGIGGWGALLRYGEYEKALCGAEGYTTNNRMELMAVIQALRTIKRPLPLCITTDSNYVKQGMTEWLPKWKQKGWRGANQQPIKNQDLWQELDQLVQAYEIEWRWVKGHSGHKDNERVDELANQAIAQWRAQQAK